MGGYEAGIGDTKNTYKIFVSKARLSHYLPGQDLRAPRSLGSQNS